MFIFKIISKWAKKILFIISSVLMISNFNLACAEKPFGAQSLDKIVATVNDNVVTQSDLNLALDTAKKQMTGSNMPVPSIATLRKQVLDQLIARKLQLELAEQNGIHVNDQDVTKAITMIATDNHMSIEQLYQQLAAQGMSQADYRKDIHEELLLQKIQGQEIGSKISVTPDEVKNYMRKGAEPQSASIKEYHLEDIVVELPESPTAQQTADADKLANTILAKLHQGTAFDSISTEQYSAVSNNDLGWRKLSEIPSAFADNATKMKKNEITGPIKTENGWHILHLVGTRVNSEKNATPAISEQQAQQMVYQHKYEEALKTWVAQLRNQAVINLHPEV